MGRSQGAGSGRKKPTSRVPSGRTERVARLGAMLAGIAGETALGALRQAAGIRDEPGSLVFSRSNARRLTETLGGMRGAAMKLGQMLSLQGEDLLPPEFTEILAELRNQAHFMPRDQVVAVLEAEFGPGWERRFELFDFEPLAAASIGQVHGARTADGRELALKIQYPGVEQSIDSDVDNLALLLRVTRLLPPQIDYEALIPELKQELHREADYCREADNTEKYAELIGSDRGILVPRVHRDFSTLRILATDRLYGRPIEDLRSPEHSDATRDRVGERLLRLVLRELFEFRFMQTDPNFGNYLFDPGNERIVLLDFGAARRFGGRFLRDYRSFLISGVEEDEAALLEVGTELGFLSGDESAEARRLYLDLCGLFAEPLRFPGRYRFGDSDLTRRVRDRGFEALIENPLPQPSPEILFIHRKLIGSFLLCAHIGASLDCRPLYRELVVGA